jgi:drug/metabolite transporter (DMT)-like permease
MKLVKTKVSAPLGASFVVLSSVFYASYGIWTKLMGNFFSGFSASLFRSALVLFILGMLAAMYRQFQPLNVKRNWPTFVVLILTSALVWGPLYYAILNAGVGVSLALNYASMVIGMFFFGWLLTGERFTKDKLLSAVLGIIGIALVFSPSIGAAGWLALGAALVSGTCSSVQYVIGKKLPYNSTQSIIVVWAASLVANSIMVLVLGEAIPAFGLQPEWGYLLLFSIASVVSTWLFMRGIKLIDAGVAGVLGLLEIVFGVLLGVLFFGENPQPIVLLGVAVIIAAASIPYIKDYNAKHSHA